MEGGHGGHSKPFWLCKLRNVTEPSRAEQSTIIPYNRRSFAAGLDGLYTVERKRPAGIRYHLIPGSRRLLLESFKHSRDIVIHASLSARMILVFKLR